MRFSTCVAHPEPLGVHLAAHFLDSRMSGHIHLHRKIRDSAVYQDSKTLHLWMEILLRASWKKAQLLNGVTLEPGQLICGQEELGESIGLSRREVRTRLQQLENCGNVTSKTTNAGTHITICNWATYQLLPDAERPAKRPASDQQATNDRPASDQRATTEEEGKEGNKVIDNQNGTPSKDGSEEETWETLLCNQWAEYYFTVEGKTLNPFSREQLMMRFTREGQSHSELCVAKSIETGKNYVMNCRKTKPAETNGEPTDKVRVPLPSELIAKNGGNGGK